MAIFELFSKDYDTTELSIDFSRLVIKGVKFEEGELPKDAFCFTADNNGIFDELLKAINKDIDTVYIWFENKTDGKIYPQLRVYDTVNDEEIGFNFLHMSLVEYHILYDIFTAFYPEINWQTFEEYVKYDVNVCINEGGKIDGSLFTDKARQKIADIYSKRWESIYDKNNVCGTRDWDLIEESLPRLLEEALCKIKV